MHIPENYLAPASCAVMAAAMVPVWVHSIKKVKEELPKEKIPMIGIGAAFSFLSMMFNVPLVGGTTGHAVGGTLIALLLGPEASCLAVSVALLLQAVIFGDGGILAFGANCFNMAFVLPFVGYYVYRLIMKIGEGKNPADPGKKEGVLPYIAAAVGSYLGINAAAFLAAVEFGVQPMLFHDAAGQALYCPYGLSVSIPAMMIPHLLVAGFVEAAFTVVIYLFVKKTAPQMAFYETRKAALSADVPAGAEGSGEAAAVPEKRKRQFPVFILIAVLIVATPLGLLAAGTAWGEWGADEIAGIVTNGTILGYTPKGLAEGWSLTPLIPDYAIEGVNEVIAYILSAIIGVALLLIIFKLLSLLKKDKRRRQES